MGGSVSIHLPHFGHLTFEEQADLLMPDYALKREFDFQPGDWTIADESWRKIASDHDIMNRFYEAFFRISASQDTTLVDIHGTGLKTKIQFVINVFAEALIMTKEMDETLIKSTVQKYVHHYLYDMGLRVHHFRNVGFIMIRTFEECENPHWNEESRIVWHKLVSLILWYLIVAGLQQEHSLSHDELAAIESKFHGETVTSVSITSTSASE